MREERPIIALDFPAFEDVKNFLEHFPEDEKLFVKIGMEFFYAVGPGAKLVAVTQLTSTSEEDMRDCQNIQTTVQESVVNYARKAQEAGLDGVVCSAHEVDLIKKATSEEFVCVTPGIRPAGAEIGDQKRVMTPQEAHKIGSDYIVVGRPIIQAENPWDAYHEIKRQWNS